MIRALIFDFDGVILETEMPDYTAWLSVFRKYGVDLPLSLWGEILGSQMAHAGFDPFKYLESKSGQTVDRVALDRQREAVFMKDVLAQPVMPGVEATLQSASKSGMMLAVASSSDRRWVTGHLERLGLLDCFDDIKTADDVKQTKPNPDLYLKSLESLKLTNREALVFEDSPNGLRAAKAAGIFAVAVPTELTAQMDLSAADMRINSLADINLAELISQIEKRQ